MNPMRLQRRFVDVVATFAPWFGPLPTAWLVMDRTVRYLAWPFWVGLAAALVVESLGLVVALTALDLFSYNASKRKRDARAPVGLALFLLLVYFVVAELLTVGLDIAGEALTLRRLTPAVFPLLSLASMAVVAVRIDHDARRVAIQHQKAEARAQRAERRKTVADTDRTNGRGEGYVRPGDNGRLTRQTFLALWPDVPGLYGRDVDALSGHDVARLAGVSTRTGRRWLKEARNQHG